jgi:diguanylate cyclase (GGDEF)-like protein/PAS domain S-box-containing protein
MKDSAEIHNNSNELSERSSELRYRRLFEAAQDGILILDAATGLIEDVNPFLIDLLGYSREEFVQKKLWEVGSFKDIQASKNAFQSLQRNEYIRYKNLPLKSKSGKLIQVEFVSNVYLEGNKKVIQCNIRDITERKLAQDALLRSKALLHEQSVRDHLTGLFNRRYMEETLKREVLRASRKQTSMGILMLDIDNFKQFNDNYGHAVGDAILHQLSCLFTENIREEDIVCRYGGDEFIIVLPDTTRATAIERAEHICEIVKKHPFRFAGQPIINISLSLGVAIFPENGQTFEKLMKVVDDTLFCAKHNGRGLVAVANKSFHH